LTSIESSFIRARRPSAAASFAIAIALVAAMVLLRVGVARNFPLPVGYGVPIALMALLRRRRLLWGVTACFAVLNVIKFFYFMPEVPRPVHMSKVAYDAFEGVAVLIDLLLVAWLVDMWLVVRQWLEKQNAQLESANADLASREEEIARQNEELQSQTEELERQSEELRVTNEELSHRQKTLEILLSLSRSLTTELSRGELLSRICETLGLLINGPGTASAILEQVGDDVVVRCHHGFGDAGISEDRIPVTESFASLVLTKGRTGYLEDISLRPDLRVPQPKQGPPVVAILAAPLRVGGWPVGTLEVYHREARSWDQEQIGLVESLAAQASVSLEAAHLFDTVSRERNRFEAVLKTVPVGVTVANADCTEIRLNPAGAAMLNVPADANIAQTTTGGGWAVFRNGQRLSADDYHIVRAARHGEESLGDEVDLVIGGRRVTLLIYARPIRDAEGRLDGGLAVFADISQQKEQQRELDARRREAEEASVRKTRFLAAVSHDIRTPANAISLLAELIRRTATSPSLAAEVPDLALELHASAMSLVNLLGDVLDVARFDSDKIELQEAEFPLAPLLTEEHRQLLPLAREKGLALEVDPPPDAIVLRTDRIKLARVVSNLVGNAIKFTDRGEVRIAAEHDSRGLRIHIKDTGVGIAPEDQQHIFDEFFQLRNPERDRNKGSGLGLTICKRLVEAMGGKLSVGSTPGQGSTFTVTLPPFTVVPVQSANPAT